MAAEPRLMVAASAASWVTDLVTWVAEQGGAQIVGHAMHDRDVEQADFDVLIAEASSTLLTRRLVDSIQASGRAVLVLTSTDTGDGDILGDSLGVRLTASVASPPARLISRAAEFAAQRRTAPIARPAPPATPGPDTEPDAGLTVVVGLDGVVELAVHLAASMKSSSTVLTDLDTVWPAVAQRLGLPLAPNVLSVTEDARHAAFGRRSFTEHPAGMAVIAGLANPREWSEFTAVDAEYLLATLRARFDRIVAVTSPLLEPLAPMSGLEGRYDVARMVVGSADQVVVAVPASPVGVTRALTLVADVRALTTAPVHVVVNRAPRQAFQQGEWQAELSRTFAPSSLTFLPDDRHVRMGSWDATLASSRLFDRAVGRLAAAVGGVPA